MLWPTMAEGQNVNLSSNEPDSTLTQEPEGIVYDMATESDSLLAGSVFFFAPSVRSVKITALSHPIIDPTGRQQNDPMHRMDGLFHASRGAIGQEHLTIIPFATPMGKDFEGQTEAAPLTLNTTANPFPALSLLHSRPLFQTLKPYTSLGYGSSLNKDYQISVVHSQNIKPRWNMGFMYDLSSRDGVYSNSGGTNHLLDATTNYYSEDARYQVQAGVKMNRMRQEENGGVQNDTTCWNSSRRQGVAVNMYSAQNMWRDLEVYVHQSLNTVRQFDIVRPRTVGDSTVDYDTIRPHKPHTYNTGVFALDLRYERHRRIFIDGAADGWFYNFTPTDSSIYLDSTMHQKVSAELYWTNDAYMQHRWRNPFVLTFGVRPEYNSVHFADTGQHFKMFSVSPFANVVFDLGRLRVTGSAEEVTGSHRNGDYRLSGNLALRAGDNSHFSLKLLSEAQSPDFFFLHNRGAANWDNEDLLKIKRQQLSFEYLMALPDSTRGHLRRVQTRTMATLLSDNVWLDSNMKPVQGTATGLLLQATVSAHLSFGWFNIMLQETVQHSSDLEVVRVPLLASKNSLFADVQVFHKALRLQTGLDLRWHSRYLADGWNPVLGAWYRQDDVEIGHYLVADAWITLQVKRASIYLRAAHFNAPIESLAGLKPNYFSLPHYPMEDFGLYWGVIWKFFD